MSNFYAYINRHRAEEDHYLYVLAMEEREKRRKKIDAFFSENTVTHGEACLFFELVAINRFGAVFKDSHQNDFWIAEFTDQRKLKNMNRYDNIDAVKVAYYNLCNKEEPQEESP